MFMSVFVDICVLLGKYLGIEWLDWRRQWQPTPVLLPGKIPWMDKPGGLPSMGSHRVRHDWSDLAAAEAEWLDYIFTLVQSVQSLSSVLLFVNPWTTARQASLSITNSQNLLKLMSIELVMPSISSSVVPFSSHLQSFPVSGSFQMSQFFASGGQSIGVLASASVLPMNIQDWFPLGWTGWISLQSKGLSRVFSNTTVQKHQFFSAQLSL